MEPEIKKKPVIQKKLGLFCFDKLTNILKICTELKKISNV